MTRSRQTADWGSRAGLAKIVPSSVAVGSGTGSASALGTVTFSGASSVSLNNVFSSTYDHYRVVLYTVGSDVNFRFRLRNDNSDNSTSNYWWSGYYIPYGAAPTVTATSGGGATTSFLFSGVSSASGGYVFDIFNPKSSSLQTTVNLNAAESYNSNRSMQFRANTSFDGYSFYPDSGTITGTVSVYGYTQ
jgi:hypothetical protein